jgi:ubiquitin-protein ligase E3 C
MALLKADGADYAVAKWLGRQSYLDDLASLDRDLYKGLIGKPPLPRCSNRLLARQDP